MSEEPTIFMSPLVHNRLCKIENMLNDIAERLERLEMDPLILNSPRSRATWIKSWYTTECRDTYTQVEHDVVHTLDKETETKCVQSLLNTCIDDIINKIKQMIEQLRRITTPRHANLRRLNKLKVVGDPIDLYWYDVSKPNATTLKALCPMRIVTPSICLHNPRIFYNERNKDS
jgi:hypothetical protein